MLIEGKTFEEVASISGLIRLVRKYKGKGEWNGRTILSCMIKEIEKLLKQLGFSLDIWQSELVILLIFSIQKRLLLVEELPIEEISFKRSKRRGQ